MRIYAIVVGGWRKGLLDGFEEASRDTSGTLDAGATVKVRISISWALLNPVTCNSPHQRCDSKKFQGLVPTFLSAAITNIPIRWWVSRSWCIILLESRTSTSTMNGGSTVKNIVWHVSNHAKND